MERYELLLKALRPVDMGIDAVLAGLRDAGTYHRFAEWFDHKLVSTARYVYSPLFRIRFEGLHHLPESGGCVVTPNHTSWMDVQVLATCPKRKFTFVAKSEFKEWPILRHLIELSGGLYIHRGGDPQGLQALADAVDAGAALVVFPEGTIPGEEDVPRWDVEPRTGLLRGKTGAVRLALMTGAPIVPCGISGTGRILPPEVFPRLQTFPSALRGPVTVRFGKPIRFSKMKEPSSRKELREMTDRLMIAISELVEPDSKNRPNSKDRPDRVPPYAYERRGKLEEKAPVGVLVLHGFTSHIHCVDPLEPPLKELGVPYRFPILRGHGGTYRDLVGVRARHWYEDAENALLDLAQECEKIVVVGHSMGGLLALDLAARYRSKVGGVVAAAAALKFRDPLAFASPLLSKVVKFWPSPNAFTDQELRAKENRNYPRFATDAFVSLYEYARYIPTVLSFVTAPILILHSTRDTVISPKSAEIIYERVSSVDKTLLWFEKSGHEMFLDLEGQAVVQTCMDFIKRMQRRCAGSEASARGTT